MNQLARLMTRLQKMSPRSGNIAEVSFERAAGCARGSIGDLLKGQLLRPTLAIWGLEIWRTQSRTPDTRQLIVQSPIREDRQNEVDGELVAKLVALGIEDGDLALRSVKALVTGWKTLNSRTPTRLDHDEEDIRRALDVVVDGLAVRRVSLGA